MIACIRFLLLRRSRRSRNATLLRAIRSGIPTPKPTPMPTVVGLNGDTVPSIDSGWLNVVLDGVDIPDWISNA